MKLAVEYPSAERFVIDLLTELTADLDPVPTVGQSLDDEWTPVERPHLQVALDGSELLQPIAEESTVRVTAWATSPTPAERLATRARGLLLAEHGIRPGAGMFPAQDPTTKAELMSFTVLVRLRSTPIAGS